jgi:hypothetical protein
MTNLRKTVSSVPQLVFQTLRQAYAFTENLAVPQLPFHGAKFFWPKFFNLGQKKLGPKKKTMPHLFFFFLPPENGQSTHLASYEKSGDCFKCINIFIPSVFAFFYTVSNKHTPQKYRFIINNISNKIIIKSSKVSLQYLTTEIALTSLYLPRPYPTRSHMHTGPLVIATATPSFWLNPPRD